jgi:hypothetical protein
MGRTSFRYLTRGERKRLQAGILSGAEAAMVSARTEAKTPGGLTGWLNSVIGKTGTKIFAAVQIAGDTVTAYFSGGVSTVLIGALNQATATKRAPQGFLNTSGALGQGGIVAYQVAPALAGIAGAYAGQGPFASGGGYVAGKEGVSSSLLTYGRLIAGIAQTGYTTAAYIQAANAPALGRSVDDEPDAAVIDDAGRTYYVSSRRFPELV